MSKQAGKLILPKEISNVLKQLYQDKAKEQAKQPIILKKQEDNHNVLG
jgi:hypothetical protein